MNHNHINSDSVSCEQLKAVDIISKEEGHVCPTCNDTESEFIWLWFMGSYLYSSI
jgi:hypothetical protein